MAKTFLSAVVVNSTVTCTGIVITGGGVALTSSAGNSTYIDAPTGQSIYFRPNNSVLEMTVSSTGVTIVHGMIIGGTINVTGNVNVTGGSFNIVGGGTLIPYNVVTKTDNYTAVSGDVIICDATNKSFTITLPSATINRRVIVKKVDASVHTVIVVPALGTIDNDVSVIIGARYVSRTFISDGTNWWLI